MPDLSGLRGSPQLLWNSWPDGLEHTALDRAGLGEHVAMLRDLAAKLRATLRAESQARVESDLTCG